MQASDLNAMLARIEARGADPVWISRRARAEITNAAATAPAGPLRGVGFAIKDNIDLAGLPTTAGCPEYAYQPATSAPVVQRLIAAGAIPLGKTNLDQFATGLVGVRSPYGVPVNPFGAASIPGGSSSGSAVAVAAGLCDFALGTDTAGSGRVPAACNNLVGLKPTRGLLSTRGVVPACRSLDCVSILTRTIAAAAEVLAVT
ncbi:MAG TPA: amidase family protein, partial [Lacunisphaera sp.]|nr:amidase family protein [Lacunisphaera sp.]